MQALMPPSAELGQANFLLNSWVKNIERRVRARHAIDRGHTQRGKAKLWWCGETRGSGCVNLLLRSLDEGARGRWIAPVLPIEHKCAVF